MYHVYTYATSVGFTSSGARNWTTEYCRDIGRRRGVNTCDNILILGDEERRFLKENDQICQMFRTSAFCTTILRCNPQLPNADDEISALFTFSKSSDNHKTGLGEC